MKKRIFSGIQPSGLLHIGNYLGAIKNWVELQKDYDCIFCVVDYHAITVPQDPKTLTKETLGIANIYLAAGIDPKKSIIFVQSHVPEHTELAWVLNTISKMGELYRMTQFKDKTQGKEQESAGAGLFDYPVLMAADILLYDTEFVPVGEDQRQHVELTRTLARRFNNRFGETFKMPKVLIKEAGAKIKGLDDPEKKMSKSASSANYIALLDKPDIISNKIKKAVTDSGTEIKFDPEGKPAISNLLTIYHLFSGEEIKDIEVKFQGKGYGEFKEGLAEVVIDYLKPFQKKFFELEKNPDFTKKILKQGAGQVRKIASKKMEEVREKIGVLDI
ncbi:tryptophan--tRNA ligase [bacterium (Candidatus Torokbacteria) CG_4_10_14_0_2_um_filter_35_8]|nr:MAG: tryptophan--tRNA ligase [bacterium (Candidatus Torokbacteria) CG_4_10_14_0_2_um_filter_35_8]